MKRIPELYISKIPKGTPFWRNLNLSSTVDYEFDLYRVCVRKNRLCHFLDYNTPYEITLWSEYTLEEASKYRDWLIESTLKSERIRDWLIALADDDNLIK